MTEPQKTVILDPTGLYPIPDQALCISTERQWLESFWRSGGLFWIQGKFLCNWTMAWLQAWGLTEVIREEKKHPRLVLTQVFHPLPLPDWDDRQMLEWATYFTECKLTEEFDWKSVARVLFNVTGCPEWGESPSKQHLAWWLGYKIDSNHRPLEILWQHHFCKNCPSELVNSYASSKKVEILRQWLGLSDGFLQDELGPFPLEEIPSTVIGEFTATWQRHLIQTQGAVLDELDSEIQSGMKKVAEIAFRTFKENPEWMTSTRQKILAPYLTVQQRQLLKDKQPPPKPNALLPASDYKEMYNWAITKYLPFRRWESVSELKPGVGLSEQLADDFVDWIVENYPKLKEVTADESQLNRSVGSLVQHLSQEGPVFWVVVDGLGWLDHVELLEYLNQETELRVERFEPRIAVLPTKTEYAKWSLYSQLLPKDESWKPDAGSGFSKMKNARRYTDSLLHQLTQDLKTAKYAIFCWDSDKFDRMYHDGRDWRNLYSFQRPHTLLGLAKEINHYMAEHPQKEQMHVVISSDHGQLLGGAIPMTNVPANLMCKGRMAIGTTTDKRFVALSAIRFGLPEDISVVRGAQCLHDFKATVDGTILGSHGGLFPEEVIIGVSVLRTNPHRLPVLVSANGMGESGKPGQLILSITNPNTLALQELVLYVKGVLELSGVSIETMIPANQQQTVTVPILHWPERTLVQKDELVPLSGRLEYRFPSGESGIAPLSSNSVLTIKQIFMSGGIDLEEFL